MSENQEGPVKGWKPIDPVDKNGETKEVNSAGNKSLEDSEPEVQPWDGEFIDMTWGEAAGIEETSEKSDKKGKYFSANRPTVIGVEKNPERSRTREHFETSTHKMAVMRMVAEGELKYCQDCWGARKEPLDVRRMAVADGVGNGIISGTASEVFCSVAMDSLKIELEDLPKIDKQRLISEIKQEERPEILEEALINKVEEGAIAATTLSAVGVQGEKLRYHQLGDSKIMVIRPNERGESNIVFETQEGKVRDRLNSPYQYGWNADKKRWEKYGKEEDGEIEVQKGDVVIMFTDGLYTGYRGEASELDSKIVEGVGRSQLMAVSKQNLPRIVRDNISDLANVERARDDVTLGVMIV